MLAVLPLVFFGLSLLYLAATNGWRTAFLKASVLSGLVLVASTEVLSLFRALSLPALTVVWVLASASVGVGLWRRRALLAGPLRVAAGSRWWTWLLVTSPVVLIVAATGVTAWVAPPNTYDSMAYHMARVAHWMADGTIAHYPTNLLRQLYLPPEPEFAVLHLQVLSGGDHLANLVQWFGMVGSVLGASLIAEQLGAPPRGQVLAAILVATLPMGILQASSTQTDYVLASWLVCSVSFALAFVHDHNPRRAAWFASALGLAMLTKGTAYVFAAPLVILLGVWMIARWRSRLAWSLAVMILIPALLNAGYYLRNETLFQHPLGPPTENTLVINATLSPAAVASNLIRDGVLQLGTPSTTINQWLDRGIARVHEQVLHIGLSDPRTTFPDARFQVNPLSMDEDYAGDPIHALLAIAAVLFTLGLAFRRGPPLLVMYSGGLVVAFLFFAGYLRWQPWNSRLELPLLVLSAPLIAVVITRWANVAVVSALAAGLFVAAVPWVIDNQTRPLVGFALPAQPRYLPEGATIFNQSRTDLYFVKRKELKDPYIAIANTADQANCREIGFWSGGADWEYPLWFLARQSRPESRIDSVQVSNDSKRASSFASKPCLVVVVNPDQPEALVIDGVRFIRTWRQNGVSLYAPSQSQ